jgi:hypothetical protein
MTKKLIKLLQQTMDLMNAGKITPEQAYGIKIYGEIYMQSQPEIQNFIVESIEHTLEVA